MSNAFLKEIKSQYDYYGVWHPLKRFYLGDYGYLRGYKFERINNIENLKKNPIKIKDLGIRPGSTASENDWSSGASISDSGGASLHGQFTVSVNFKKKNQFLFGLVGCTSEEIDKIEMLQDEILKKLDQPSKFGDWRGDWVVVTEVLNAKTATILIAKEDDASIEFAVKGQTGNTAIALAKIQARAAIKKDHYVNSKYRDAKDITAGITLYSTQRRFGKDPEFRPAALVFDKVVSS